MRLVCYWASSEADCEYPLDFYMVIPIDKIFYVYLKIKFIQRLYHSGKFQMFYHKAAVWGALVLKSGLFRFYAPLRIPSKRKRAAGGKILELPEPHNL